MSLDHLHVTPLERQFKLEEMRRHLAANPNQAQEIALEMYEDYLYLLLEHNKLKAKAKKSRNKVISLFPC
jgi:hypothetical protein